MGIALGAALAVVVVLALLSPFLSQSRPQVVTAEGETTDSLLALRARRDAVLEEIRLLRLDLELDTITEADFQERVHGLRLRAAILLRREEQLGAEIQDRDAALEREISARRSLRRHQRSSRV